MAKWYTGKSFRLLCMLAMTFSYFLVEVIVGYMTNSMALVADSFHMLSDVLALLIAFFCMKISSKQGSEKNTFGWVRAEVLGALVNAVFLLALCFSIFVESIKRLLEPEEIKEPRLILIVGSIGLLVNIIGIFMFHGHASVHGHSHARPVPIDYEEQEEEKLEMDQQKEHINRVAKEAHSISIMNPVEYSEKDNLVSPTQSSLTPSTTSPQVYNNSAAAVANANAETTESGLEKTKAHKSVSAAQLNMHGVFLHILGDAFGSIVVIINAIVVWKVDDINLRKYLDPSLSLVMVLIIASTTIPLLKESALILLQTVPTHIDAYEIKRKLLKIEGVLAVHEFHVWKLAGNKIIGTAHIRCRNMTEYMNVANRIKELFHDAGIHSTTIQPEFTDSQDELSHDESTDIEDDCALTCPAKSALPCTTSDQCCAPPKINGDKKKDAPLNVPLLTLQVDPTLPSPGSNTAKSYPITITVKDDKIGGAAASTSSSTKPEPKSAPVVESEIEKL